MKKEVNVTLGPGGFLIVLVAVIMMTILMIRCTPRVCLNEQELRAIMQEECAK